MEWNSSLTPTKQIIMASFSRHALTPPSSRFTVPQVLNLQPGESVLETSRMTLANVEPAQSAELQRAAQMEDRGLGSPEEAWQPRSDPGKEGCTAPKK